MSSSNLVRITGIKESSYGETPGAGNFTTFRFISEGLSGTPDTVESQQIRTDRMGSGQVVVGMEVGGDMGFELAKETALEALMESAMMSTWDVDAAIVVAITTDVSEGEAVRASGSFVADGLIVGDFVRLQGAADTTQNVVVMVTGFATTSTANDTFTFVGPEGMEDTADYTGCHRCDKLTIGTTKNSYSIEKAFTDLTTKAIIYRGMLVSQMELNFAYGELAGGSFSFSGNDYETADAANEFITDGRTIDAAATTNTLNGSVDMPFLASAATGALAAGDLDLQSVSLTLNNNLSPQNVIGEIAPTNYSPGTAQIEMSLSAYLTNNAWSILGKKISQEEFALGFMVKNTGGGYGFYFPALQVTFEDPASAGANQDISLEMTGRAKVGTGGVSAMSIYRIPA